MGTKEEHSFWAYFRKRVHFIDQLIPHLARENPRKIHTFRLEVKRLFSLLDMLAFKMDNELVFTSIKNLILPLYKATGKVRTKQIYLKQLNKVGLPHLLVFKDHVLMRNKKARIHLREVANQFIDSAQYPLTEVVFDILNPVDEEGLTFCYVQKMQNEISTLQQGEMKQTNVLQWHDTRKSIKCLLFLDELEPLFYNVIKLSPVYLNRLKLKEKMIGKWHDEQMLQKGLSQFLNAHPELMVNVNMIRLRYKLKSELSKLEQIIQKAKINHLLVN